MMCSTNLLRSKAWRQVLITCCTARHRHVASALRPISLAFQLKTFKFWSHGRLEQRHWCALAWGVQIMMAKKVQTAPLNTWGMRQCPLTAWPLALTSPKDISTTYHNIVNMVSRECMQGKRPGTVNWPCTALYFKQGWLKWKMHPPPHVSKAFRFFRTLQINGVGPPAARFLSADRQWFADCFSLLWIFGCSSVFSFCISFFVPSLCHVWLLGVFFLHGCLSVWHTFSCFLQNT